MFAEIYIFLLTVFIPFFWWQQREEGRNVVSILITGVFLVVWLLGNSLPFSWDNTTLLTMCFSLWMIASITWSNSRQSTKDLYMMLSCMVVFLVSRGIKLEILLAMLILSGVVFAACIIYYHKSNDPKKKWFIFGNNNHTGAFLLIPFFSSIWMTLNYSYWIAPIVAIIALALFINKGSGSQIGACFGLIYIGYTYSAWTLLLLVFPALLVVRHYRVRQKRRKDPNFPWRGDSFMHRISIMIASLLLIKKSLLCGFGLRTFRREFPNIIPSILENKFYKKFFASDGVQLTTSHRIHNDQLEIIFELGIIGYILFIAIFTTFMFHNVILSAAIIAFGVSGLFFFPLREAHTAYPFWALAGGIAGAGGAIAINPLIALVLVFIVGKIMFEVSRKLLGLFYYDHADKINVPPNVEDKKLELKQRYLNEAIKCDPYNNVYLTEGYFYNVFTNPELAFQYASRCMENYDGGKVRWGVADQYARALLRLGGFAVAKMAATYALHICPDFKQSRDLINQIEKMEQPKVA